MTIDKFGHHLSSRKESSSSSEETDEMKRIFQNHIKILLKVGLPENLDLMHKQHWKYMTDPELIKSFSSSGYISFGEWYKEKKIIYKNG